MKCDVWRWLRRRSRRWAVALGLGLWAASGWGLSSCVSDRAASSLPPTDRSASETTATETLSAVTPQPVAHRTIDLPTSRVHVVTVPPDSGRQISVVISESLTPLAALAAEADAIAAINAGFFDPQNGLTTSYVVQAGAIVADPQQNPRLMDNPDLEADLPAILDRSEFRIYDCDGQVQYDIVNRSGSVPAGCVIAGAVGAGPQLLPAMTGYEEGFLAENEVGETVRDALGSQTPNARSAIGLKPDGTVVLAIATQLPDAAAPTGLTLPEMAELLASLGVATALNLDGGSSTGLYLEGDTYWGRIDETGAAIERPIKSILVVR